MDIRLQHEWNVSAWQATNLMFLKLFKEKLILASNRTDCIHVQPPKELTTEALSMIVVMTIFVIFAVLGSLSTAIEFLYEKNTERKKLSKSTSKKNFTNILFKKAKGKLSDSDVNNKYSTNKMQLNCKKSISIRKDWLRNSRSFLHCFCFVKNGKKLFQTDPVKIQFECLHGIRVISNFGLICFHVGVFNFHTRKTSLFISLLHAGMREVISVLRPKFCSSKGNMDKLRHILLSPIYKLLWNTVFGVDAFFVLSGFLNAYSFSKAYDKKNGKICWWHFYLKRFLRLTPTYMAVFGFYTTLLSYTGSGPIWPEYATNPVCKENWWRYLLYINNFELGVKSCMLWYWHLAAEMQVYVVSPIFLLSLLRWQRFGYSLASITIFLSSLSSFLITKQCNLIYCSFVQIDLYIGDFESFLDRNWMCNDALYYKPYTRISSYLIGVLLGYYCYDKNFKDIRNRWITLCFGWIAAGILIWISFFALLKREGSVLETAIYNSVKHLFFSVGLSWIIFVCLTKQGSFINDFLSWKLFLPFSKLSYCAYLIHMVIIQRDYQAAQDLEEFSVFSLVLYVFRVYFWTIVFSIPGSLLFEMPMNNLFALYMNKEDTEKRKERNEKIKKK